MYDQLILRNDRGNTYTFSFVHGIRGDGQGGFYDKTYILSVFQSVDNEMFDVEVLDDEQFETLRSDLENRRGYRLPGSDTQAGPVVSVDMEIDGDDPDWKYIGEPDTFLRDDGLDIDDPPLPEDEDEEDYFESGHPGYK